MTKKSTNWAGNYVYRAERIHHAESVEQLQELVYRSSKCKALGTRHSFNDIADSSGELISLEHFNNIISLDREHQTVTVEAGARYGELARWLHAEGYALHNLASLPHISVAGACATATHGSGVRHGNLATAVAALEMIRADGEMVRLVREKDEYFAGAVVNLGALGIVTRLTLDISPSFQMQQDVYENLQLSDVEHHFDDISTSAYSVSLFTDWRQATFNQVWVKQLVQNGIAIKADSELYGARLATRNVHPIASLSAENCTEQMGVLGPWFERLPHFRLEFTPSSGEELQSEYILPRKHAFAALQVVNDLRERIAPLLQISEVRTIAADTLWMSPSYGQDCVAMHFTWKQDWQSVKQVLPLIEEGLDRFDARPHWGKLFTMAPERLQSLYKKLPEFRQLLQEYDPLGKFNNLFLNTYIFDGI